MSEAATSTKAPWRVFPRAFWVVNGIELVERGAFYSLSAVFTVFMNATFRANGMENGAAASLAGTLGAVLFLLLYVVPVVGAPFTEKFGYKRSLALVFVLLLAGYAVSFVATSLPLIIATIVLIGVGAGIFKPIPASIVSQTSTPERRNLAFAIYYACINIGALVFPLGLGLLALAQGWDFATLARVTFATSATLAGINLLLCIFVFKNLNAPRKEVSVLKSVKTLGDVFRYPAFLALMAIYAGFWFIYVLSLTFLSQYMVDFSRMPAWFNVSLLQVVNPLVIIVLAPFSGLVTKRIQALPLMVGGIMLYALGLVTLGFSSSSFLFITGVVIFSIGELMTHPSYLAYVTRIAPPEKVSVFLGYGFIPIGVGQFFGAKIGGSLYGSIALNGAAPKMFWAIMATVGLATAAALAIYNLVLARSTAAKPVAPGPERGPERRRFPVGAAMAALAILLVLAVLAAATLAPGAGTVTPAGTHANLEPSALADVKLAESAQQLACGKEYATKVTLPANATGTATFTVTWKTPAPSSPAMQQSPDSFELHVTPPSGEMAMTQPDSKGKLELKVPAAPGDYDVVVKLSKCGAESPATPIPLPGGAGATPHTQASFTLGGSYQTPK